MPAGASEDFYFSAVEIDSLLLLLLFIIIIIIISYIRLLTVNITADYYIDLAVHVPGCVAGDGSLWQRGEIGHFADSHFQLIAVEILGPINESVNSFLYDLGRRISLVSGEDKEPRFLFQRISVTIQRFNAVLLHDGFLSSDHLD